MPSKKTPEQAAIDQILENLPGHIRTGAGSANLGGLDSALALYLARAIAETRRDQAYRSRVLRTAEVIRGFLSDADSAQIMPLDGGGLSLYGLAVHSEGSAVVSFTPTGVVNVGDIDGDICSALTMLISIVTALRGDLIPASVVSAYGALVAMLQSNAHEEFMLQMSEPGADGQSHNLIEYRINFTLTVEPSGVRVRATRLRGSVARLALHGTIEFETGSFTPVASSSAAASIPGSPPAMPPIASSASSAAESSLTSSAAAGSAFSAVPGSAPASLSLSPTPPASSGYSAIPVPGSPRASLSLSPAPAAVSSASFVPISSAPAYFPSPLPTSPCAVSPVASPSRSAGRVSHAFPPPPALPSSPVAPHSPRAVSALSSPSSPVASPRRHAPLPSGSVLKTFGTEPFTPLPARAAISAPAHVPVVVAPAPFAAVPVPAAPVAIPALPLPPQQPVPPSEAPQPVVPPMDQMQEIENQVSNNPDIVQEIAEAATSASDEFHAHVARATEAIAEQTLSAEALKTAESDLKKAQDTADKARYSLCDLSARFERRATQLAALRSEASIARLATQAAHEAATAAAKIEAERRVTEESIIKAVAEAEAELVIENSHRLAADLENGRLAREKGEQEIQAQELRDKAEANRVRAAESVQALRIAADLACKAGLELIIADAYLKRIDISETNNEKIAVIQLAEQRERAWAMAATRARLAKERRQAATLTARLREAEAAAAVRAAAAEVARAEEEELAAEAARVAEEEEEAAERAGGNAAPAAVDSVDASAGSKDGSGSKPPADAEDASGVSHVSNEAPSHPANHGSYSSPKQYSSEVYEIADHVLGRGLLDLALNGYLSPTAAYYVNQVLAAIESWFKFGGASSGSLSLEEARYNLFDGIAGNDTTTVTVLELNRIVEHTNLVRDLMSSDDFSHTQNASETEGPELIFSPAETNKWLPALATMLPFNAVESAPIQYSGEVAAQLDHQAAILS